METSMDFAHLLLPAAPLAPEVFFFALTKSK
jgi:hypothetical protein